MPTLIGTGSNQVPTNGDLGTMAFQDSAAISVGIATVSGNVAVSGITTLNANVILGSSGLSANGGFGTAGQLLNSNGSATYWAADRSANAYTNAVAYVDGKLFVNTSQLSSNLANYQTTAGLSANVATLTANNATNLGGVAAASYVNTSGAYTITGMLTYTNGITFSNTITANGSNGTAGQVLTSSGTTGNVYWAAASGGVSTGKAIAMAMILG